MNKEEIIRGEDAIQEWRKHLITQWQEEPLRLARATPEGEPPLHLIEFQSGHKGWLHYGGNDVRYPLVWGCNLVGFYDGYQPPAKLAIGIDDADPEAHELLPLHHTQTANNPCHL